MCPSICVICERVCVTYNSGFKGWFDFSLLQQDPVNLSKESMGLDGFLAALAHHAAQTLCRVFGHELHTNTQTIHTSDLEPYCPLKDAKLGILL